jgi:hypothetical protein
MLRVFALLGGLEELLGALPVGEVDRGMDELVEVSARRRLAVRPGDGRVAPGSEGEGQE